MTKDITYNEDRFRIEVRFPFSVGLVARIKTISDARWDNQNKCWHFPTAYAAKLIEFGHETGMQIDPKLMQMTGRKMNKDTNLRKKLFPFQNKGVDFLHKSQGRAILADEMGCGKTVEALIYWVETGVRRLLVVCPASVAFKWKAEVELWTGRTAEVVTNGKMLLPKTDVVIISYTLMTKRIAELYDTFEMTIFDECHALQASNALRTKAAKAFKSRLILGLSGTPFLNRPIEMYNFLNLLYPSTYTSYFGFGIKYCAGHQETVSYRNGEPVRVWKFEGLSNLEELKDKLQFILLRRTKKEVLKELPDITKVKIPVIPSNLAEYQRERNVLVALMREQKANALELITHLRHLSGMGKIDAAVELAEDILVDPEKKVVLYAHHKDVVLELESQLIKYGVVKIVGDVKQEDRNTVKTKFQTNDTTRVMIISSAGGEGIDLYRASDIIFVEREWNPGREAQAYSRLHRIGQKNAVTVHYLIAKGTMDEHIDKLIDLKRDVFGAVIGADEIAEIIIDEIS